ncbi:TRAP transporter small permease [Bacillus sp. FJAT-29814]|uniref:TRAP transporter small permease n=1 Tax=Bacillus sp. FJAT-29814 TaxID=1729688 RepID=UPI00082AADB1|nr:TRAP transporter small permease [Bacillus sp. FJAT-29814]
MENNSDDRLPKKAFWGSILSEKTSGVINFLNSIVFLGMLLLMFAQVLSRYVIHEPIPWSEELIRYAFIITTYFGAAIAVQKGVHVEIDIVQTLLSKMKNENKKKNLENIINLVSNSLCFLFVLFLCWLLSDLVIRTQVSGQESPILKIPMSMISGGILLSFIIMAIYYLLNILEILYSWGRR